RDFVDTATGGTTLFAGSSCGTGNFFPNNVSNQVIKLLDGLLVLRHFFLQLLLLFAELLNHGVLLGSECWQVFALFYLFIQQPAFFLALCLQGAQLACKGGLYFTDKFYLLFACLGVLL